MEYPPNAMPNEGVDAIAILAGMLTETTQAEPSLRQSISQKKKISWEIL
jgi:hypothetical protein